MALKIAHDVLNQIEIPGGLDKIDPATITIMVDVISNVIIYIIQNCVLNKKTANDPNFIQKARLRLVVNRHGRQAGLSMEHRSAIYNALLKKGANATEEDINETLAEAGNN